MSTKAQLQAASRNINVWNAQLDKAQRVRRLGRQGILYEYIVPYGANPMEYYKEAIDVKSIKRSENYNNGYRIGTYQPIGDKRYFTYYQLKKMKERGDWEKFLEDLIRRQQMYLAKLVDEAIHREFGD